MKSFDPQEYGPVFATLLDVDRRRPLDGGAPSREARDALSGLSTKAAFAHATRALADREMASCCIAGMWLLYDDLDQSHAISQSLKSASGSFWHAIMHRREGDFSNSKYWYRRVGRHPVFDPLAIRATQFAKTSGQVEVFDDDVRQGDWDPFAFVDFCERVLRQGGPAQELCLDIQQAEWELLFDHCYGAAIGR